MPHERYPPTAESKRARAFVQIASPSLPIRTAAVFAKKAAKWYVAIIARGLSTPSALISLSKTSPRETGSAPNACKPTQSLLSSLLVTRKISVKSLMKRKNKNLKSVKKRKSCVKNKMRSRSWTISRRKGRRKSERKRD